MLDKVNIEPILQRLGLRERASQGKKFHTKFFYNFYRRLHNARRLFVGCGLKNLTTL